MATHPASARTNDLRDGFGNFSGFGDLDDTASSKLW